jgi:transposase-like protein
MSRRIDLLPENHAIGKLARQMETSDAASRFSEDQIIGVLREHEAGVKTADLCRKHGIGDATFYNWKAKLIIRGLKTGSRSDFPAFAAAQFVRCCAVSARLQTRSQPERERGGERHA